MLPIAISPRAMLTLQVCLNAKKPTTRQEQRDAGKLQDRLDEHLGMVDAGGGRSSVVLKDKALGTPDAFKAPLPFPLEESTARYAKAALDAETAKADGDLGHGLSRGAVELGDAIDAALSAPK